MINSSCMRSTHACGAERSFDFLVIAGILAHYSARKRSFFISCMSGGNAQAALQPASARPDPGLRSGGAQPLLYQGGSGALHHPVCRQPANSIAGRTCERRRIGAAPPHSAAHRAGAHPAACRHRAVGTIAGCHRPTAQTGATRHLTVTTTSGFASLWLIPRLRGFTALQPEVDVRISASFKTLNLERSLV